MGMLRRADIQDVAREALVMNLADMAREGRAIVDEARREAEAILADARAERARLIADAAEEGHAIGHAKGLESGLREGERAGREAAQAEHAEVLARLAKGWEDAITRFEAERERSLVALRRDALCLAVQMAERVVKRSISYDKELVVRQVEAIVGMLSRPTRLVLEVHPQDEAVVREMLPDLIRRFAEASHVDLVTDPCLDRGSCVARTDAGATIDASIRTQIERLTAMIMPLGAPDLSEDRSAEAAGAASASEPQAAAAMPTPDQNAPRAKSSEKEGDGASRSAA
jgi:flagellar biosynthesis/type III secretory pathway protein FliH